MALETEERPQGQSSGSGSVPLEPWRDMVCGTVGGMVSKLAEHPLDTIKVRLQAGGQGAAMVHGRDSMAAPVYRGPLHCLTHTLRHEGLMGLYQVSAVRSLSTQKQLTREIHDMRY